MVDLSFLPDEDRATVVERLEKWDKAMLSGVQVEINITQWQAQARLNEGRWARLGLKMDTDAGKDALRRLLRGGRLELAPPEILRSISRCDTMARRALQRASVEIWSGRLVLAQNYAEFKREIDKQHAEFVRLTTYLAENLWKGDCLVNLVCNDYTDLYSETWATLAAANAIDLPKDEFIAYAIDDIRNAIPGEQEVLDRYTWNISLSYAPMVDEIAERELRAATLREETLNSSEFLANEQKRIQDQIHADVQARAEDRMRGIVESLEAAERAYHEHLVETINEVHTSFQRNSRIHPRSAAQMQKLVEYIKAQDVMGNDEISPLIEEIQKLSSERGRKAAGADIEDLEKAIVAAKVATRRALNSTPQYVGKRREVQAKIVSEAAPRLIRQEGQGELPIAVEATARRKGV